jgi:cold shock CspA family protein
MSPPKIGDVVNAVIRKFMPQRRFGFATGSDSTDFIFFYDDVITAGLEDLKNGMRLTGTVREGKKSPRLTRVEIHGYELLPHPQIGDVLDCRVVRLFQRSGIAKPVNMPCCRENDLFFRFEDIVTSGEETLSPRNNGEPGSLISGVVEENPIRKNKCLKQIEIYQPEQPEQKEEI